MQKKAVLWEKKTLETIHFSCTQPQKIQSQKFANVLWMLFGLVYAPIQYRMGDLNATCGPTDWH